MAEKQEIIYKNVKDLIPYANNTRTHDDKQIKQIAASIKEFGFTNPILIGKDNDIIAGHGRVLAAEKIKFDQVPCIVLDGLSEAQKKAYIIADNKLALNAGWDEELLKIEIEGLKDLDFDLSLTGFNDSEICKLLELEKEDVYTKKSIAPQYEITDEDVDLSDLVDCDKTNNIIKKIELSNVSKEEKIFLINAAQRHMIFNYKNIAEYYAKANEEMQSLMEESALVIIDYDDAILNGYCSLNESLIEMRESIEG